MFFDKLSNKLLRLFCLFACFFFFFSYEIAFSSILRIKTIFFRRHSILREKKSQVWTHAYTDHIWRSGSYTMMAKPINTLELHYPMIQFLIVKIIIIFYKYMMEKYCVFCVRCSMKRLNSFKHGLASSSTRHSPTRFSKGSQTLHLAMLDVEPTLSIHFNRAWTVVPFWRNSCLCHEHAL